MHHLQRGIILALHYIAAVLHKGLFRISCKGGWSFCWGLGYPFPTMFPRGGYQNFMETPRGSGIHFVRVHTKKETELSKIFLSRNSPATLDAPFAWFAPAALKNFRHPGGVGVPIFDSDSKGGLGQLKDVYWKIGAHQHALAVKQCFANHIIAQGCSRRLYLKGYIVVGCGISLLYHPKLSIFLRPKGSREYTCRGGVPQGCTASYHGII